MKPSVLILGGRDPLPRRASKIPSPRAYGSEPLREVAGETLGWHLSQLQTAADRVGVSLQFADYESLTSHILAGDRTRAGQVRTLADCDAGGSPAPQTVELDRFNAILTRTMPAGSLEQITFRLAGLHDEFNRRTEAGRATTIVNPPAGLEWAIDKFATLARAARLGLPVPDTFVTQSRGEAMRAFDELDGDVVVKPIFGGEGRGVMRIRDRELAWTTFATLQQLGAVAYVQRFRGPGGRDVRLLVIGETVHAIRRINANGFRTNVRSGGKSERAELTDVWSNVARRVCGSFGLTFAAVDLIETDNDSGFELIEVNAIPGWRSAQSVVDVNLAEQMMTVLKERAT